jgi:hypothetical protein
MLPGRSSQIPLVNRSTATLPFTLERAEEALTEYAELLGRVWDVQVYARNDADLNLDSTWPIYLADDTDQPDALAYHALDGSRPYGIVFVKTTLRDGVDLLTAIAHEFAEMAYDPWCVAAFPRPAGWYDSGEIADAVEGSSFPAKNGLLLSNFVYPAWFGLRNPGAETKLDHLGLCKFPGEILEGGYIDSWEPGSGWRTVVADGSRAICRVEAKLATPSSRLARRRAQFK